jgi:hypothetical protein
VAGVAGLLAVLAIVASHDIVVAHSPGEQEALSAEEEQSLGSRVAAWWTARQARDHQAMYELFDPSYRSETPFAAFLQESAVRSRYDVVFNGIVKLEPRESNRAAVFVELGTTFQRFPGTHNVTVEEAWIRVSGAWYKVHEPFKPPFPVKPPG